MNLTQKVLEDRLVPGFGNVLTDIRYNPITRTAYLRFLPLGSTTDQGILTEGEGSVQLTFMLLLI